MQVLFQLSYSPTGCGVYQRPPLGPGCATEGFRVEWSWHHRRVTTLDLLLRGGTVVDGGGGPGVRADVGVLGDRILAVGDLSDVDVTSVATVVDCTDRIVAPGFIDPHGHSDGSLFVDGALASHLHQGYTTQLSGNCGDTLAPIGDPGRELVELALRPNGLVARWRHVRRVPRPGRGGGAGAERGIPRRPRHRPRVGVGRRGATADRRGAVGDDRRGRGRPRRGRDRAVDRADLRAGHARRGGRGGGPRHCDGHGAGACTRPTCATRATGCSPPWTNRSRRSGRRARPGGSRSRTSSAARGRSGARPAPRSPGSRRPGRRVSTWRPTSTRTRPPGRPWRRSSHPPSRASASMRAWRRSPIRTSAISSARRSNGASPAGRTWPPTRAGRACGSPYAASHPDWAGRSLADLADELHADPSDLAFDALVADRLDVSVVIECMSEPDVETIMAVPWIAVCTDAEGRRPGHPILDAGRPHPRSVRQHGHGSSGATRATAASCPSRRRSRS